MALQFKIIVTDLGKGTTSELPDLVDHTQVQARLTELRESVNYTDFTFEATPATGYEKIDLGVSSKLKSVYYNKDSQTMLVEFPNKNLPEAFGAHYRYYEVPQDVITLLLEAYVKGESVGGAFSRLVEKAGYKYEKVSDAFPG